MKQDRALDICPVDQTLRLIGYKWAGLVVWQLMDGPRRHGELLRALPGISPKTLTDRLRELEGEGVLTRHVFAEVPPRVEYALTDRGRSLYGVYEAMVAWAKADRGAAIAA
jgi:DNA-binding HxlR family transcriptional regulator